MNECKLFVNLFKTENLDSWFIDIDYWLYIVEEADFISEKAKVVLKLLIESVAMKDPNKKDELGYWSIYGAIKNRDKNDSYANQVTDAIRFYSLNEINFSEKIYFEHLTILFRAYDEAYKSLPCVKQIDGSVAIIDFQDDYTTKTKIQKWIEYIFWKKFTKQYTTIKLSCGIIHKNWKYLYNWKGLEGLFDNPQYICEAMRNVSTDFTQLKEQGKFGTPDFMIEYKMWNPFDSNEKTYENEAVNQDDW